MGRGTLSTMLGHPTRSAVLCASVAALGGCHGVFGLDRVPAMPPDAPIPGSAFSDPRLIDELRTTAEEDDPSFPADLTELYLLRAGELLVAKRATPSDPWSEPTPIVEINTAATEFRPCVSADGLTLYFTRDSGQRDVFVSERATRDLAWSPGVLVAGDDSRASRAA